MGHMRGMLDQSAKAPSLLRGLRPKRVLVESGSMPEQGDQSAESVGAAGAGALFEEDFGVPEVAPPNPTQELHARMAALICMKFSPLQLWELRQRCGGVYNALFSHEKLAISVKGVSRQKIKAAQAALKNGAVERELEACARTRTNTLLFEDALYPPVLSKIDDPPLLLWQRGELSELDHLAFAVVGSRAASYYGTKQSARFATALAQRGVTVVSGLARGIDTAAHKGALEAGGRTIAVVGSGFEKLYPPENDRLADQIAEQGVLLSEYPLYTPGRARNFPVRNRIISGLSLGVLVVQADMRSGSLITARLAAEQGREVFAVPGKIDDEASRGTHALIKDGARLAEGLDDILEEIPALKLLPQQERPDLPLPPNASPEAKVERGEAALLKLLKPSDETNVEVLIRQSGMRAGEVNAHLLNLEMRGLIRQLPGRNYALA